jgi:carboxypeptidase C (cathepsin A)
MRAPFTAAALAALICAAPAAALPQAETPVVTRHEIRVGGRPLRYSAEAGRIAIRDVATGEPRGFMFYVAYRVPSPGKPRPVAFVWNGGPGSPATILHFEAAGPRRLEAGGLVDNAETWLTDSDLIFVDPIGTGFSRPAKAEYAEAFYGTVGDVASVAEFVRAWRLLHAAEDAPLYLAGESWGAGRAANVGHALLSRGIRVDGLVLISGGAGLKPPAEIAAEIEALRLANLPATVAAHGRAAISQAEAEQWVSETYIPALRRAKDLGEAERDAVVAGLARVTGLAPDKIDRETLKVTPRQFRTGLIEGKTLDTFDMRLVQAPRDDADAVMLAYLRGSLGYRSDLPYVGLEDLKQGYAPDGAYPEPVGARWNYATGPVTPEQVAAAMEEAIRTAAGPPQLGPPLPGTIEAVGLNPKLKVLVASGLYDSLANCAGYEALSRRLEEPVRTAVSFRCYAGGHMMYRDAPARIALSRDVRDLIAGGR